MLSNLLQKANLFHLLYLIDSDLATIKRSEGCPHCGGPLHTANYRRKPRGGPPIPEIYCLRSSLCCGRDGCRRRSLPASCLFMGRRVYWRSVVLVITAFIQRRPEGWSVGQLSRMFGIPRRTIMRWHGFFSEVFVSSLEWTRIRGRLVSSVVNSCLPASLLEYCLDQARGELDGLVLCCRLLGKGG
jgi:hypothetical protein